jgi:carboxylate-amine ligase
MINYKLFTLGIEEEYMVIDPRSKELVSHEQKIVIEGQKLFSEKVKAEMHQAVVEVGTDVCANIDEARAQHRCCWNPPIQHLASAIDYRPYQV